jgi:pyruvate kinase
LTHVPEVQAELSLIWAVDPMLVRKADSTEEMLKIGEQALLDAGIVERGDTIVVMAGRLSGLGLSSSVSIYTIGGALGPKRTA